MLKGKLLQLILPLYGLALLVFTCVFYREQIMNRENLPFILLNLPGILLTFGTSLYLIYRFFCTEKKILKVTFNLFSIIMIVLILIFSTIELKFLFLILFPFVLSNLFKIIKE